MKNLFLFTTLVSEQAKFRNKPYRRPVIQSNLFGMIIFVITEIMFFSGLISAYLIIRSGLDEWPPWGQPRLPINETAINTIILLLSGVFIYYSRNYFSKDNLKKALLMHDISICFGLLFVILQGIEWFKLLNFGLTITSSVYGALFYLIIGAHAFHVIGALISMTIIKIITNKDNSSKVISNKFLPFQFLWYFVIGIWPVIYILVYII